MSEQIVLYESKNFKVLENPSPVSNHVLVYYSTIDEFGNPYWESVTGYNTSLTMTLSHFDGLTKDLLNTIKALKDNFKRYQDRYK